MFLVNSRQRDFRCGPDCSGQAILLTYGRLFAEFLNEDSLVRLGVLHQPTCVGFRYGCMYNNLRRFSGRPALPNLSNLAKGHFRCTCIVSIEGLERGFSYALRSYPERKADNAPGILDLVTPSIIHAVQEY